MIYDIASWSIIALSLAGIIWLVTVNIAGPVRRHQAEVFEQPLFSYQDYKGVIHFHTVYSDGAADFPEVIDAAGRLGMDFLVASDHNTVAAAQDGWEGWHGNTLLLIGEEKSANAGHMLVFNLGHKVPNIKDQEVVNYVGEHKALSFIAHPYNLKVPWKDWSITGFTGIEVANFEALCRWKSLKPFGLLDLVLFFFSPRFLENVIIDNRPWREFEKWDKFSQERKVVAIGGSDAHGFLKVGQKRYRAPSYYHSFQTVWTHVLTPEKFTRDLENDRAMLWTSIASGHAYVSFDTFASPDGFQFTAQGTGETAIMGDSIRLSAGNPIRLQVLLPPAQEGIIHLLRNGKVVARLAGNMLKYTVEEAGVYRVEVYHFTAKLPFGFYFRSKLWIISNPIYIKDES